MSCENFKDSEQQKKLNEELSAQAIEEEAREVPDEALEGISGGWPQMRTPLPPEPEGKIV